MKIQNHVVDLRTIIFDSFWPTDGNIISVRRTGREDKLGPWNVELYLVDITSDSFDNDN